MEVETLYVRRAEKEHERVLIAYKVISLGNQPA